MEVVIWTVIHRVVRVKAKVSFMQVGLVLACSSLKIAPLNNMKSFLKNS